MICSIKGVCQAKKPALSVRAYVVQFKVVPVLIKHMVAFLIAFMKRDSKSKGFGQARVIVTAKDPSEAYIILG